MELFITYALFTVLSVTVYLIRKEILIKQKLHRASQNLKRKKDVEHRVHNIGYYHFEEVNAKNQFIHPSVLMLKSLRHLDFMSQLEAYLDASGNTRFKTKYRKEFLQNKLETQQTVLKSASMLSRGFDIAA